MTEMPGDELVLYHAQGACSLAVAIALAEADLPHRIEMVDLTGDRTEYRRINPSGKVPALALPTHVLTENLAILTYVAMSAPDKGLLSSDHTEFCRQLSLMGWFASTVHITRRQIRRPSFFSADPEVQPKLAEAARPKMWQHLVDMDARVSAAPWFSGDRFGLVDTYALVLYGWAARDGFVVSELPALTAWKDRMLERPTVRDALLRDLPPLCDEAAARVAA